MNSHCCLILRMISAVECAEKDSGRAAAEAAAAEEGEAAEAELETEVSASEASLGRISGLPPVVKVKTANLLTGRMLHGEL